jgi:hypothetical protein
MSMPESREIVRVRQLAEYPFATLEGKQSNRFLLLMGRTMHIPIQIHGIEREHAKIIYFTTDTNAADVSVAADGIDIVGKKPGKFKFTFLVVDKMYPYPSGDPEVDEPLELFVEVL